MGRQRELVGLELIRANHGMASAVAAGLGIARSNISRWTEIPSNRAHDIARITGLRLSQLRPDLWPPRAKRKRRRLNGST